MTLAKITRQPSLFLLCFLAIVIGVQKPVTAKGFFGLSLGYYNAFGDAHKSAVFKAEYIPDKTLFINNLKPWIGAEFTSNLSAWLGGGILYDIPLTDQWTLTPSFGAGFYRHGTSDIDLDYPIEFKSQLRVSYQLKNEDKVAFSLSHTSNASLGDHNRGEETLAISYLKKLN